MPDNIRDLFDERRFDERRFDERRSDRDSDAYPEIDGRFDEPWMDGHDQHAARRELGDLLEVIVMDDQVVDVRRRAVQGTGYEGVAVGLGRAREPLPVLPPRQPEPPRHEQILAWLSLMVGGDSELMGLDSTPLPDEELNVRELPQHLRDRVVRVDAEVSRATDLVLGREARTAARRLLSTATRAHPALWRTTLTDEAMACAALTAVAKANDLIGQGRIVPTSLLRTLFNLRSAPHDKVRALTQAVAPQAPLLRSWPRPVIDVPVLGSPDYLVGAFRAAIIETRDAALHLREVTPQGAS